MGHKITEKQISKVNRTVVISTEEKVSLHFLGSIQVLRDNKRIESQLPQKGLSLLAYLSSFPGIPQPRQKLAELFWPDLSEEAARNNLRQVLLKTRRCCAGQEKSDSFLATNRHFIQINHSSRYSSDIAEFLDPLPDCTSQQSVDACSLCMKHLESVTGLYQGQFLENLLIDGSPEFDDWLQIQREMMHQRALFLLERLTGCWKKQGVYDKALLYARRFLELDPWSEEGVRRVINLAALNGQRGFALNQYQTFCRTIKDDLGVQPEAKTRKLAETIQAGELLPVTHRPEPIPADHNFPAQDIERRQITICYCQFLPTVAEDPEDEIVLLSSPLARGREILSNAMGYIEQSGVGGGLLVYFGYPHAQEKAAVLAIRAALLLVAESFHGVRLQIGIYTGTVLSAKDKPQPDIAGRASGRAIGLSSLAGDGEVIISETTHKLTAGHFKSNPISEQAIPRGGNSETSFRVAGATGVDEHRSDHETILTPFVGRSQELNQLIQRWQTTRQGNGQVLLLQGEPGIGKSRLVRTFRNSLASEPCVTCQLHCSFEFSQSPFKPVINFIENLLDSAPSDNSAHRADQLQQILELGWPDRAAEALPLFAELLSLPLTIAQPHKTLSPRQKRQQTMALLLDLLAFLAKKQPVLLIVEDLHWIDPTTLETLSKLFQKGLPAGVFLLLTTRPDFSAPWPEATVPRLKLTPLPEAQISLIIAAIAPNLSIAQTERIVHRADGVPLFAEELSRLPVDSLERSQPVVPTNLQDLLTARLDILTQYKKLAQLAASIGREFPLWLLKELSLQSEPALVTALLRLKNAGLLLLTEGNRWQFRHVLIRDAAYLSQTRADRESAHRRIAQIFAAERPEILDTQPELLAYHWDRAGETESAIKLWLQAGLLAQTQSAHQEALEHFSSGLKLLPGLPTSPGRVFEWPLQVGLGAAAYAIEGYASAKGAAAYQRAVELSEQDANSQQSFPALWGLWAGASSHSSWEHSLQRARRLVQIVKNSRNPVIRQQSQFAVGNVQFWRGEFVIAQKHLQRAIKSYTPDQHDVLVGNYGENAFVTSSSYLSWCLCLLGFPEQALQVGQAAVVEAERCEHPFSLGYALTFHTVLHRMLRLPAATLELAERTIALATKHDLPLWLVGATLKKGWAQVRLGQPEGLAVMQQSVEQVESLMGGIVLIFLETQADGLLHAGKPREALVVIDKAMDLIEQLDDHHAEAELYRLKGLCLLVLGYADVSPAENALRTALKISRRQKALLYELRAARALASLQARQNKPARAKNLLTDVYHRFTEGFSFPDLISAEQLIVELKF